MANLCKNGRGHIAFLWFKQISMYSIVFYSYKATHLVTIQDVDINSFVNKRFHNIHIALSNCDVQDSPLMEKRTYNTTLDVTHKLVYHED